MDSPVLVSTRNEKRPNEKRLNEDYTVILSDSQPWTIEAGFITDLATAEKKAQRILNENKNPKEIKKTT